MQEVSSCWICVDGCGSGARPDGFISTYPSLHRPAGLNLKLAKRTLEDSLS